MAKLVFQFLGQDETEPSTNQTYGHEEELEDFANDVPLSPMSHLYSIRGYRFFAHLDQNASAQVNPLVISKYGASEDYPGGMVIILVKFGLGGSGLQNHLQHFCTGHCRDQETLEAERR
ncbi:hypothetical protein CMV_027161 [Castanea mollissima]|uniref:Uncharacterized protein n=1 Tax=Castanea mollissima TaxID=60419 RepID=A0A8J4Q6X8_9ROSI|nr:hypothetical protein CMV_027161 [Castanea mollissima]